MEEEMKELYAEGLATHGGPEACADDPRGRGEALRGARAGRASEPRSQRSGEPRPSRRRQAITVGALSRGGSGTRAGTRHPGAPGDGLLGPEPEGRAGSGRGDLGILRAGPGG